MDWTTVVECLKIIADPSTDGKTFKLINPYTHEPVADGWRDLSPDDRGAYLRKLSHLIKENMPELARLESISMGKPVSLYIEGKHAQGTSSVNTPDLLSISLRRPYGVSAFAAKSIAEAGFPPGVVNIISGFRSSAGSAISSHMDMRCLSFTGSTSAGQNFSIHFTSGQTCIANYRIYVQESVADKFIAVFKEKFGAARRMGNPFEPTTNHGPQADNIQYERVTSYLETGEKDGKLTMGGDGGKGFIKPTVFENVPDDSRLMKEEVFGPVVAINTFKIEEAIERVNTSEFGLYASVFTKDMDRAVRLSKLLEAGTVGVNSTSPTMVKVMPIGGYKQSGLGREGLLSGLDSYLETKTVLISSSS
ncbi:Aldehyde/histidinol dehydrogenase [Aspergillus pseudotamarii]|uniref:aldehyde dehydrogenase (NAD(+)) n=1 Tax=Aspergillus pseudotamarii TaxID=132259 RepID=A0A5N6SP31_ASPPS|nr:Aldehyde/histidinol dehydrogenase [Aspergillus pseudotamarii]KAE8135619.1 Aldehyde/histidinol dehydrogenase [Aspergillus pseudotamarii]